MKKNFLMVASLLIAAMLMVVSCTQEVAPENDGRVEAKLNVAYGRDLSVTGDTKQDALTLTYKMSPMWSINGANEAIYGGTKIDGEYKFKEFPSNGNLGYVTPGLWQIVVQASGHDVTNGESGSSKTIFEGTANVYFNETTKEATVFLAPVSTSNNTVQFNFLMQDLSEDMNSDYYLSYSIYSGADYSNPSTGTISGTEVTDSNGKNTYVRRYTLSTPVTLPGGFYRVNVSIYRKGTTSADDKLVGGTTKGFLVSGGANVVIGGNIEPSDYENVSINAYYYKVDSAFDENFIKDSEGKNTDVKYGQTVNDTTNGGSKVKMKVNATVTKSSTSPAINANNYTYLWTAVSDGETMKNSTNVSEIEFVFNSPGWKNISCTTVYSVAGTTTGGEQDTYYFADTISTHVYVDPSDFKVKTTTRTNE